MVRVVLAHRHDLARQHRRKQPHGGQWMAHTRERELPERVRGEVGDDKLPRARLLDHSEGHACFAAVGRGGGDVSRDAHDVAG
jgi:hypothetical protein